MPLRTGAIKAGGLAFNKISETASLGGVAGINRGIALEERQERAAVRQAQALAMVQRPIATKPAPAT